MGNTVINVRCPDNSQAIRDAGKNISESNNNIAKNILLSSEVILKGLSSISDELERKRYTEEYYLLMDKIDELEDKIIALGEDLQKIYSTLKVAAKPTFDDDPKYIRGLAYVFCKEEHRVYLENAILAFDENEPIYILDRLAEKSKYQVREQHSLIGDKEFVICHDALGTIVLKVNRRMLDIFLDPKDTINPQKYPSVGRKYVWYSCNPITNWVYRYCDYLEENAEDVSTSEQLASFNQLTAFISGINSKIMVGNLRSLHSSLRDEYKKLKYSKCKRQEG